MTNDFLKAPFHQATTNQSKRIELFSQLEEPGLRYLKQIKARNTGIVYHSENVLLASVEKRENLLQFVFGETATEREHLKTASEKDKAALIARAKEMAAEGASLAVIAEDLGVSKPTASRYVNS